MNRRQKKVSEEIKHIVSEFFIRNTFNKCEKSFITLTKVDISPDLKYAKIYISILNLQTDIEQEECLESVIKNRNRIRKEIADNLILRNVPEITIKKDESFKKAERIKEILRDIKK
ncbi:MAG: 30S ribosome-binding factor RbfA [Candidatus Marinimicrobia bacterium]|nr:30S ribosome-binding factor RbfA [Candidatus Neomarinimicrobiota bacterium]